LHRSDHPDLGRVHERDHLTLCAGSCRSTRTVNVGRVLIDGVVMHHALDTVDMNTTGCHIGGDQGEGLARGKITKSPGTLCLRAVAVDGGRRDPHSIELAGGTVSTVAGAGEDDRRAEGGDDRGTQADPVGPGNFPEMMLGSRQVRCRRSHAVVYGVGLVLIDQLADIACEGGREQDRVPLVRSAVEDASHSGHEAHVGHAIGLVDHHRRGPAQVNDPAFNEILETPRRCHEHIDPAPHPLDLRLYADTAVDRRDTTTNRLGRRAEFGGDLLGEFTSGSEDQCAREARLGPGHPRQHRNPERKSLAGAGRGAAHDVVAPEQVGNCGGLDLKGGGNATPAQNRDNWFGYAEIGEGGTHRGTLRQRGWCATSASSTLSGASTGYLHAAQLRSDHRKYPRRGDIAYQRRHRNSGARYLAPRLILVVTGFTGQSQRALTDVVLQNLVGPATNRD